MTLDALKTQLIAASHFTLLLLFGCTVIVEPGPFVRHSSRLVYFKSVTGFVQSYSTELSSGGPRLEVMGLLYTVESTCGELTSFTVGLGLYDLNHWPMIEVNAEDIQVFQGDSLLSIVGIDTVNTNSRDGGLTIDAHFGGDTCKTISIVEHPFDSVEPKVKIYFGDAIRIGGDIVKLDTIFAYK